MELPLDSYEQLGRLSAMQRESGKKLSLRRSWSERHRKLEIQREKTKIKALRVSYYFMVLTFSSHDEMLCILLLEIRKMIKL